VTVLLFLIPPVARGLTITGGQLLVQAVEGSLGESSNLNPAGPPFVTSHTAEAGAASITFDYDFSETELAIHSLGGYSQTSGEFFSIAGINSEIVFTVDDPITYSLTGTYSSVDPSGLTSLWMVIAEDLTTGEILFRSDYFADSLADFSYSLGSPGGD